MIVEHTALTTALSVENASQHIHKKILKWEAALHRENKSQQQIDAQIQECVHFNIRNYLDVDVFDGTPLCIEVLSVLFDCVSVPRYTTDGRPLTFKERLVVYTVEQS